MTETTTTEAPADLNPAERFFYNHAGYTYVPDTETPEQARVRSARDLAAAECWAGEHGYDIHIEHDPYVMPDDVDSVELVMSGKAVNLCVVLIGPDDKPRQSLSGVVVASEDDDYLRVVAAELAAEERAEIEAQAAEEQAVRERDALRLIAEHTGHGAECAGCRHIAQQIGGQQ